MRALCVSILICASFVVLAPVFGQDANSPYLITISADKPTVAAGSNVFIKVKLTNISNEVVDCSTYDLDGGTDRYYQFDVRDENGTPVKKRDLSLFHDGSWRGKCDLEPGKSLESEKLVSWLHDFSKPGKYLIQISRRFSGDPNPQYAKSNTIIITVLPPNPPAEEPK